jgi:hypothetical protein
LYHHNEHRRIPFWFGLYPRFNSGRKRSGKEVAKKWLLENKSIILGGNVWFLAIKDLGLGICEVRLRPASKRNTYVVKEWEKHA